MTAAGGAGSCEELALLLAFSALFEAAAWRALAFEFDWKGAKIKKTETFQKLKTLSTLLPTDCGLQAGTKKNQTNNTQGWEKKKIKS